MISLPTFRSFSLLLSIPLALAAPAWIVGQQVDTSSGPVTGHGASLYPEVSEYLGIPYAAPPVGELRWQVPQPFKKSGNILVASKFGPDCSGAGAVKKSPGSTSPLAGIGGTLGETLGQTGHNFSEDCLTVNVWAKPQVGEKKKAVLVWFFGGGFTSGTANSASYNGQVFAEKQDVVVVSFKYVILQTSQDTSNDLEFQLPTEYVWIPVSSWPPGSQFRSL
jgi:carboxylesterase type B